MEEKENAQKENRKLDRIVSFLKKYKLIMGCGILSALAATIIHFAFYLPAKHDFFVHQWGAGDILTYIGTVSLGLLALWQNQKFKEESDKTQELLSKQNTEAQERIERIYTEANELSIITRIIDFETRYLMQLEKAGREVLSASQTYTLCDAVKRIQFNKANAIKTVFENHTQSYIHLMSVYSSGLYVADIDITPTMKAFEELNTLTCNMIKTYHGNGKTKIDMALVDQHLKTYHRALKEMTDYLGKRRKVVHRILTENMSAKDVKMIYSGWEKSI